MASDGLFLTVGIGIVFRVKRLVCADIADGPGALLCAPCESECLANAQDFLSMDLATK